MRLGGRVKTKPSPLFLSNRGDSGDTMARTKDSCGFAVVLAAGTKWGRFGDKVGHSHYVKENTHSHTYSPLLPLAPLACAHAGQTACPPLRRPLGWRWPWSWRRGWLGWGGRHVPSPCPPRTLADVAGNGREGLSPGAPSCGRPSPECVVSRTFLSARGALPVDSTTMETKAVKRYVTVGTVVAANKRVQFLASNAHAQSSAGAYLSSGERLNMPTRTDLEAAGRKVLASCSYKKAA